MARTITERITMAFWKELMFGTELINQFKIEKSEFTIEYCKSLNFDSINV